MCLPGVTAAKCLLPPAESRQVLLPVHHGNHRNIQKPVRKQFPLLNLLDTDSSFSLPVSHLFSQGPWQQFWVPECLSVWCPQGSGYLWFPNILYCMSWILTSTWAQLAIPYVLTGLEIFPMLLVLNPCTISWLPAVQSSKLIKNDSLSALHESTKQFQDS
jgi:hypothetical protein